MPLSSTRQELYRSRRTLFEGGLADLADFGCSMLNATMPVKDLDAESRIELPKSLFDPFRKELAQNLYEWSHIKFFREKRVLAHSKGRRGHRAHRKNRSH